MTFSAKIKIEYNSKWNSVAGIFDDEVLPEENITMEIPSSDLNTLQLFKFFSNFLRAIGYNEISIMKGACYTAFNDSHDIETMRKVSEEFDIKLYEDHIDEIRKLEAQIVNLKAKLSRIQNPDNPNYTDEELDAMYVEKYAKWNEMIPGSPEACDKGCKCPILDNQEMPEDKKWVNGDCPIHGKIYQ